MRSPRLATLCTLALTLLAAGLLPTRADALSIVIDYRFDFGFFADSGRRQVVERAAQDLGGLFDDALTGIVPGLGNSWTARFTDPSSGLSTSVDDLVVPADSLVVFAGARDLGESTLARAGFGTASTSGTPDWASTVRYRGQPGAADAIPTDFGPWGGAVAFDADTLWHADLTLDGLGSDEADLYTTALHELSHVLGFGLAGSWNAQVSIGRFTGPSASQIFGDLVPLHFDQEHWEQGTESTIGALTQVALMNPTLPLGVRRLPTDLDVAALRDIGWTPVPEPGTAVLLVSGLLVCVRRPRPRAIRRSAQPCHPDLFGSRLAPWDLPIGVGPNSGRTLRKFSSRRRRFCFRNDSTSSHNGHGDRKLLGARSPQHGDAAGLSVHSWITGWQDRRR